MPVTTKETEASWPAVETVVVNSLFGKYNYSANLHPFSENPKGPISLFYGRNGSGKTTLLKLIYAAISPSKHEGLKNYLSKTPFRKLSIGLADGTSIVVKKSELIGGFRCTIRGSVDLDVSIRINERGNVVEQPAVSELLDGLSKLGLDLLLLRDDRRIQTTYSFAKPHNDEDEDQFVSRNMAVHRRRAQISSPALIKPLLRDATFFVEPILSAVNEWIRDFAFRQGNTGEKDASRVYLDVIRALKRGRSSKASKKETTVETLQSNLLTLSTRLAPFAQYGLIANYPFDEFVTAISDAKPSSREHIIAVMDPFVTSIRKRLDALTEVERVIGVFQSALNSYLTDKRVKVDVIGGVRIYSDQEEIDPSVLSSGEKQLIFLLSAALLSRIGNCIFIVDEPELSLNFEWQRTLVDSLLDITAGGNTQFIMATHSIEILSKHRSSMINLD